MKEEKIVYLPPQVEVIKTQVEKGFASSTLDYRKNPSMPYGDDGEEWF